MAQGASRDFQRWQENLHIWVVGWTGELGHLFRIRILSDDATRHSIVHCNALNDGCG